MCLNRNLPGDLFRWPRLRPKEYISDYGPGFSSVILVDKPPLDTPAPFRPPDIHVGGLIFYQALFLFRQLISELAERNSTIFGHMVGSKCNLKMHVRILGYPTPLQTGGQKTLFGRLRNSTAALTAYIFE